MICDVTKCRNEAVWHAEGMHFCGLHMPIEPLPGEQKTRPGKGHLTIPEVDSDVTFLLALAAKINTPETAAYHTRLTQIAGRIQEALDLQAMRLIALRQDRKGVPPVTGDLQGDVAAPQHVPDANYVGRLQEMGQQAGWPEPEYGYERQGEDHEPLWHCTITYGPRDDRQKVKVTLINKKAAKQAAAERALMGLLASNRKRILTNRSTA